MRTPIAATCHEAFCCADCGHDTKAMGERYMVAHWLWESVMWGRPATMLCIGCLEDRFGRRLYPDDFIDCPLNHGGVMRQSLRLRSRLGNVALTPKSAEIVGLSHGR